MDLAAPPGWEAEKGRLEEQVKELSAEVQRLTDELVQRRSGPRVDELGMDGPAVHLTRRKKGKCRESLTDPSLLTDEEPAPIKRRLFECLRILTIDIGATRTKFMYQCGKVSEILPPAESEKLWASSDSGAHQASKIFRARLAEHLVCGNLPVGFEDLDAVIFAVPGTVDLTASGTELTEDMCVVRNMPSMSPQFKGFNFKRGFIELFPKAKIYALADNMAAAMGVASDEQFRSAKAGLVVVLGTAPAVATFFRTLPPTCSQNISKTVELGIWQSWVWFTKIPLKDPYGYCGGIMAVGGNDFKLRDPRTEHKIPHPKSRIRFALDSATWKRLRGRLDWLPRDKQGNLDKEEAGLVWSQRVQAAIDALALRFHHVYGKPDVVVLLGGNALKCAPGSVQTARYIDPDFSRPDLVEVPVVIPDSDEAQMRIHMRGLAQAANYRISQVVANGTDPLARGWTRGGEIYLWVRRREVL